MLSECYNRCQLLSICHILVFGTYYILFLCSYHTSFGNPLPWVALGLYLVNCSKNKKEKKKKNINNKYLNPEAVLLLHR